MPSIKTKKVTLKIGDLYFIFLIAYLHPDEYAQNKTLDNCSSHFKVKNTPSEFALTKQILSFFFILLASSPGGTSSWRTFF